MIRNQCDAMWWFVFGTKQTMWCDRFVVTIAFASILLKSHQIQSNRTTCIASHALHISHNTTRHTYSTLHLWQRTPTPTPTHPLPRSPVTPWPHPFPHPFRSPFSRLWLSSVWYGMSASLHGIERTQLQQRVRRADTNWFEDCDMESWRLDDWTTIQNKRLYKQVHISCIWFCTLFCVPRSVQCGGKDRLVKMKRFLFHEFCASCPLLVYSLNTAGSDTLEQYSKISMSICTLYA